MGTLFYGMTGDPIEMPDDVLAHVKAVATAKLRRGEGFTVSWTHPGGTPPGRTTIWMHAAIPLRFRFDTCEKLPLDAELLHHFVDDANSGGGLLVDLSPADTLFAPTVVALQPA